MRLESSRALLDRGVHDRTPFDPGAVIVPHVAVSQQVLEHKPRVRAALADPAIRNDILVRGGSFPPVKLLQIVNRLERAVLLDGLGPGNALRTGDVPSRCAVSLNPRGARTSPLNSCGDLTSMRACFGSVRCISCEVQGRKLKSKVVPPRTASCRGISAIGTFSRNTG